MTRSKAGRWGAASGVVVLASVVGAAVLVHNTAGAACAAPVQAVAGAPVLGAPAPAGVPTGTATHSGMATYYTGLGEGGNLGNCGFPSAPADNLFVALGPDEYAAAGGCGAYLDVTGRRGTVRVKVVDSCPGCAAGHLDLSGDAFAAIDDLNKGKISITYRGVVSPASLAGLSFVVKEGSSRYWLALLVDNHGNPLSTVELREGSSWRALDRQRYNYWLASSGAGDGPFAVRITDVYGNQAIVSGITLSPGVTQQTSVHLYGAGSAGGAAAPSARTSPPPVSPTPSTLVPVPSSPAGSAPPVSASVTEPAFNGAAPC